MIDFDKEVHRQGTYSMKWDVQKNELPMWVADMDFETAPCVKEALEKRVAHGIFGYTDVPQAWKDAYVDWWKERHQFTMDEESLIFTTGVVPAISSIVRKCTTVAEKVLIQTPVYNIFFNSIRNNGREIVESPLAYDGYAYSIDFERLEKDLSDPQVTMMILCNPHNPIGKIWSEEELKKIGQLCEKHHVIVVSDEIHCDITKPGKNYVPFAKVCPNHSIVCMAPTKAFNLAGLQTAAVYVPNPTLRHKVWRGLNTDEVAEPNAFAIQASIAAFTQGQEWLDSLNVYIQKNKEDAVAYIQNNLPDVHVIPSDCTYLLWMDCRKVQENTDALVTQIRANTGLVLSAGSQYGQSGQGFIRMNLACRNALVHEGLRRLKEGIV